MTIAEGKQAEVNTSVRKIATKFSFNVVTQ